MKKVLVKKKENDKVSGVNHLVIVASQGRVFIYIH